MENKRIPKSIEASIERQKFIDHLNLATKIVNTWPAWKQNILGGYNGK